MEAVSKINDSSADQSQIVASNATSKILDLLSRVPTSKKILSSKPGADAREIAHATARHTALTSGSLSLPVGPLGWATILPEMLAVWNIQAQMVADISALYGKSASLTKEQMIYCLFRHTAAQAVRDLVVRVGERLLVKRATLRVLKKIAEQIGVKVTQRVIGKGLSRWVPIIGAVGVGGYAYYDTMQVAKTAIELFSADTEVDS